MAILGRAIGRPVLPFRAFAALTNRTLGELIVSDPGLLGRQAALLCGDGDGGDGAGEARGELFGEDWTVQRKHCATGSGHVPFAAALGESRARALGVAYSKGWLGPNFRLQWTDPEYRYFRCRAALRFSAAVAARALGFLRREFEGLPFLAVQWRRGGRVYFATAELSPPPEVVLAVAAAAAVAYDLTHVYLMTNCGTAWEVEAVLDGLRARGLTAGRLSGPTGWRAEHERIAVETAVAALAEHVLVSPSAVGSTVVEERVLLGFGTGSWGHLVPGTGYAEQYDELFAAVERELQSDADLGEAVRSQAGAGRRALECAQELEVPIERCADILVASARALAVRAWPRSGSGQGGSQLEGSGSSIDAEFNFGDSESPDWLDT